MKKRFNTLVIGILTLCFILSGCKAPTTITSNTVPEIPDYSNDMVLCSYDNLTCELNEEDYAITDEIIDAVIYKSYINVIEPIDIGDNALQIGDIVNLSVDCKINDISVYWTDGSEYIIGNHAKSEIFDEQLIGHHVGDEITFSYEYPEDYEDATYAGQTADYTINILSAQTRYVEINDDFATRYTEFASAEELRTQTENYIAENAEELRREDTFQQYMEQLIEGSTFTNLPNLDILIQDITNSHRASAESLGISDEEYCLEYFGLTPDEYDESLEEFATQYLKTRMIVCEIARREGITVTQSEYDVYLQTFLTQSGVNSLDELDTDLDMATESMIDILMNKVTDRLIEINTQGETNGQTN